MFDVARASFVLFAAFAFSSIGCDKTPPSTTTTSTAPAQSTKPAASVTAPTGWTGALAAKEGKGWFDVTTSGSAQAAPMSGKQCAHWTLFYEGTVEGSNATRVFSDEWPKNEVPLTIEGKSIDVPILHITWEIPDSMKKEYVATDKPLPPKVQEMLTSKVWMNKEGEGLPAKVIATERCLAPATKYRGETRKQVTHNLGLGGVQNAAPAAGAFGSNGFDEISYDLAIAPAP